MRQLLVSEEDALIVCEVIRIDVNAEAVEEDVVAAPPLTHAGSATGAAARTLLIHVEVYDELLPQPVGDECVRRDEFDSEGRTPQFVESEHEGTNRRAPKFCFPLLSCFGEPRGAWRSTTSTHSETHGSLEDIHSTKVIGLFKDAADIALLSLQKLRCRDLNGLNENRLQKFKCKNGVQGFRR